MSMPKDKTTQEILSTLVPVNEGPFSPCIEPWEIDVLPYAAFPGKIVVIESTGPQYDEAIHYLSSQTLLGFDTESKPTFSPRQRASGVSLLQLSGPEKAYLFRIKKMGIPPGLKAILADEKILKVGAAVLDDVRGLQEREKFLPKGFVDLQRIVWKWGITDKSVKKMTAIILSLKVSKTQQLSNWEAPVLSPAQRKYAATDAWVCHQMYLRLLDSPECEVQQEKKPHRAIPPVGKDGNSLEVDEKQRGNLERKKTDEPSVVFEDGVLSIRKSGPSRRKKKNKEGKVSASSSRKSVGKEGNRKKRNKGRKRRSDSVLSPED